MIQTKALNNELSFSLTAHEKLVLLSNAYKDLCLMENYDHELWKKFTEHEAELNHSKNEIILTNMLTANSLLEKNVSITEEKLQRVASTHE
mmetsp:Transcript_8695/g.9882  ORF Transcript_8695/g.9882 Transcript_8695/m.9882 type:complete len:91 (-) Transcript_8695:57-329(-)